MYQKNLLTNKKVIFQKKKQNIFSCSHLPTKGDKIHRTSPRYFKHYPVTPELLKFQVCGGQTHHGPKSNISLDLFGEDGWKKFPNIFPQMMI